MLAQRAEAINNLNVFPVPDGDTGTNMLLTMRAAARSVEESDFADVGGLADVLAHGALMGARGNSGVILSQYLRGLAVGLKGHAQIDGLILANALAQASSTARLAVGNPVDGTMLTVARDVADSAAAEAAMSGDLVTVMSRAVDEGRMSVARTREIMPILQQAGVVDSGAMGLLTVLEGMYLQYVGRELPTNEDLDFGLPNADALESQAYGYCTEFLLHGKNLNVVGLRMQLGEFGDSLLVVGDSELVRVHVHTFQPGRAIDVALAHGEVDHVKIENMQDQSDRLRCTDHGADREALTCALVVVSTGEGFAALFKSLGAIVVPGGQTLNPSTEEILRGFRRAVAHQYVLLPNNPNVLLTANQASSIWGKPVTVVPTRNLAEGVGAAVAFQPGVSAQDNAAVMGQVIGNVRTGLVSEAVRAAVIEDRTVAAGDILGILDDRIEFVGRGPVEVALQLLERLGAFESEVITIYAGADAPTDEAEVLRARVSHTFSNQQVDLVHGGQPHYRYILACE